MQGVSIVRGFFGQQRKRCRREEELTTALVHKGALCITAKSDRRGPKWVTTVFVVSPSDSHSPPELGH
jgi:hypothetical protein